MIFNGLAVISTIMRGVEYYKSNKQDKVIGALKATVESLRIVLIVLISLQIIEIPILVYLILRK